jgi:FtsP/CotA-like multicopper oxidase with cupredoxin domain
MNPSRRRLLQLGALVGAGAAIRWQLDPTTGVLFGASRAFASAQVPHQTPLNGANIPQFVTPLSTFVGQRVQGASLQVGMFEFQQRVLPDSIYSRLPQPFSHGTYLWGYDVNPSGARGNPSPSWPGTTIEAQRGSQTTVRYVNNLPNNSQLRKLLTIDETIHWADPLNAGHTFNFYTGPIPTVVHLHGAEVQSFSDGQSNAWFTNDGRHGSAYFTAFNTSANAAVYEYPNKQQATTLWFHDHVLGMTRINVYGGLAAFYLIRDQFDTGESNNALRLPADKREIELMIQDRQFDVNGQLYFPDGTEADPNTVFNGDPPNPAIHPYWLPEFFGDVICVNGRSWPFLNVEPRRYRFRIVNGSNARFLRMTLADSRSLGAGSGPAIWQIGTDGGLLDRPVKTADGTNLPLFLAPSERADVIVDFSGLNGRSFTLTNNAEAPFPSGDAPGNNGSPATAGVVMQFRVNQPLSSRDNTFNPATDGGLRGGRNQEPAIVRLASNGQLANSVRPLVKRQLVLVEVEGSGGPIEVLVNNTKWDGLRETQTTPVQGSKQTTQEIRNQDIFVTELPRNGSTEEWEVFNLTEDAHPIHIHLIQFQLINRQAALLEPPNADGETPPKYRVEAYDPSFSGGQGAVQLQDGSLGVTTYPPGQYIPGFGPPKDYSTPNTDGALGGNPAFKGFLDPGGITQPDANETGWKDTIKMLPSTVTRIVARWAPVDTQVGGVQPGQNLFAFDPTRGPGYLLHCHILDHEDNEMMRPYIPV